MRSPLKLPQVALSRAQLYRSYLNRPSANASIGALSRRAEKIGTSGAVLCEALWDHPHHWLRLALFRRALAPIYGNKLVGVFEESTPNRVRSSLRSLGLAREEVISDDIAPRHFERARSILAPIRSSVELLGIDIAPGYPTHAFYDGVLKQDLRGTIELGTPELEKSLARTFHYIDAYQDILARNDVKAVVVSHPTTLRFSTLVWAALARSLPVFVLNYRNNHITIRRLSSLIEFNSVPEDVPIVADRDQLTELQRQRLIEVGKSFLAAVYSGEKGEINVVPAFQANSTRAMHRASLVAQLGVDPNKPNVVVMASCWPDFPNAHGRSYFADFVEWMRVTCSIAKECNHYNWIFKRHPAEHLYGRKVTLEKIVGPSVGGNIFLWPDQVSGSHVREFADCAVTAGGSVGFEYPVFGARALVSRPTGYTDWGFTNFASNAEEYTSKLRTAAELPLPTKRQGEDAAIYIALRLTVPSVTQEGGYLYPLGRLSYKLWGGIPDFVERNEANFDREIALMEKWLRSGASSYNVFKGLNPELW